MLIARILLAIALAVALLSWGVYQLGPLPNSIQSTQSQPSNAISQQQSAEKPAANKTKGK
jgi:hypothetical protein